MEQALTAILTADPQMALLLSGRIHWMLAPQSETGVPYLVLSVISKSQDQNYQGISGLTESRIQFDTYTSTFADACAISDALIHLLTIQRTSTGILGCFVQSTRDFVDDARGSSSRLYRRSTDVFVFHKP